MKYSGRIQCHAGLNDLIYHALIRAEIPALMEPQGLSRDDGKRPDGLTLVPWQSGRSATWDVTVVHTLAPSYVSQNALQAGSATVAALVRELTKYNMLSATHIFFPVTVVTLGLLSDKAHSFIAEIGRRAVLCTADPRDTTFLYQRISLAIQRFNTLFLAITVTVSESPS